MWLCGAFAFREGCSPPSRVYGGDVRPLVHYPKPPPTSGAEEARKLDDPRGRGSLHGFAARLEGLTVAHFQKKKGATTRTLPRPIGHRGKSAVWPLGGNGEEDEPERERRRPRLF